MHWRQVHSIGTRRTRIDVAEAQRRLDAGQSRGQTAREMGRQATSVNRLVERHGLAGVQRAQEDDVNARRCSRVDVDVPLLE